LKTKHGGLSGTEDTGYDDSLMSAYVSRDAPLGLENLIELGEDEEDELVYITLL
jgi:hypothetical protein